MDVLLTFDNLGEAYDLIRFGHAGGAVADGVYAVRRGVPRVLDFLARRELKATFFVEGWNAQKYPELVREIASAGHDVGAHGWLHEQWDELSLEEEAELIKRTTGALGDALGHPPVGWRSPWARTTRNTLRLLADNGYRYDSSFADEDVPYRMHVAPDDQRTIVELPFTQVLNDTPFYTFPGGPLAAPEQVIGMWWGELSGLASAAGFAVITSHPRHSARPARFKAFAGMVDRLLAGELGDVRFLRADEAAAAYDQQESTPTYSTPEVLREP